MTTLIISALSSIIISFICSIVESAFLSLKLSDIEIISLKYPSVGNSLKKMKATALKTISSILILNTFANTLGAVGVGAASKNVFGNENIIFLSSSIFTLLVLYFSEIIPKTIGANFYKELAPIITYTLKLIIFITYPFTLLSNFFMKFFYIKNNEGDVITKEDIIATTYLGVNSGSITEIETNVISNILNSNKTKVLSITTPRSVVFALQKDTTANEAYKNDNLENFKRFSRIPIYDKSIDDIVGVVYSKNILHSTNKNTANGDKKLEEFMRPIGNVNGNIPLLKVMEMFIRKKEHLLVVLDKYEQTSGIVSLEDCIENILGVEIMDETDTVEDMQKLAKNKFNLKLSKSGKYKKED